MLMVEQDSLSIPDQFAAIAAESHGPVERADHGVRFHAILDGVTYKSIAYFIEDAVILHIPIITFLNRERVIEIVLLLNYLNLSIPFGNFELIDGEEAVSVRYRSGFFCGEGVVRPEDFATAMVWADFFMKKFRGALESVSSGFADVLSVIEKLESDDKSN